MKNNVLQSADSIMVHNNAQSYKLIMAEKHWPIKSAYSNMQNDLDACKVSLSSE